MAATDAKAVPIKGQAYRVTFPIYDADGDLVSGAAGLDSEISQDGGAFADCTNEAVEIATSSGIYYLDLTASEMNADTVAVIVKTTTAGAKTTVLVLYPEPRGLRDLAYPATSGRSIAVDTSGRVDAVVQAMAAGVIAAATFAAGAIDANALAADAVDEIWDEVFAELGVGQPPATPNARQALMLLYMALRNASQGTANERRIKNDAGTTIAKATVSWDGTTLDQGKLVSG